MTHAAGAMFPPCPSCGSHEAVEIAYGYPSVEMSLAEQRGEIVLGGCVVGAESPDYECRDCHAPLPWVRSAGFVRSERAEEVRAAMPAELFSPGGTYGT